MVVLLQDKHCETGCFLDDKTVNGVYIQVHVQWKACLVDCCAQFANWLYSHSPERALYTAVCTLMSHASNTNPKNNNNNINNND